MTQPTLAIEAHGLVKNFDDNRAADRVDLRVPREDLRPSQASGLGDALDPVVATVCPVQVAAGSHQRVSRAVHRKGSEDRSTGRRQMHRRFCPGGCATIGRMTPASTSRARCSNIPKCFSLRRHIKQRPSIGLNGISPILMGRTWLMGVPVKPEFLNIWARTTTNVIIRAGSNGREVL